jgi:hypothetical protein
MSLKRFLENNNVAHKITIKPDGKHDREKFLTACTCGTEGRFVTLDEAKAYAQVHCGHYGLDPAKCITISEEPYVAPGLPQYQKPAPAKVDAAAPPPYAKGGAASSASSQAPPPYVKV